MLALTYGGSSVRLLLPSDQGQCKVGLRVRTVNRFIRVLRTAHAGVITANRCVVVALGIMVRADPIADQANTVRDQINAGDVEALLWTMRITEFVTGP